MASARFTVNELLTAVQRRLRSSAVALIVANRKEIEFCGANDAAGSEARPIIAAAAHWLLDACNAEREPVIRNRVRQFDGGPLLGRFLALKIQADQGAAPAIVVAYNDADGEAFGPYEGRVLGRYVRLFANVLAASRDPLTGLPDRANFEAQVLELHKSTHRDDVGALLYGDIDQLHVVNDLWGFEYGDRAITHVSRLLVSELQSEAAIVSRLSGDRFTVFLPQTTLPLAGKVAERLCAALSASRLPLHEEATQLTMSWGVTVLKAGDGSLGHGLAAAEIACKTAKHRGGNGVEIYEEANESVGRRRDDIIIVRRLRAALDAGRVRVFGQPIARLLQQDETSRYEMLVRMVDDNDKLVMPSAFMSAATRHQLLPQLDRIVISHVLEKLGAAARRPGFRPVHVAFNVSAPTIGAEDFLEWLPAKLLQNGVPGSWVGFELTETTANDNPGRAQHVIDTMSAHGCTFALDNFGTGASALALLNSLKVSTLKIDGLFIRDLLANKRAESLVRAIAQLANSMGIEVVAECVESAEICMRLIELQVQFGQGFAIGRPRQLERILDPLGQIAKAS